MTNNSSVLYLPTVNTVSLPGQLGFIARQRLVKNTSPSAVVKISWLSKYLVDHFLDLVEGSTDKSEIIVRTLPQDLLDEEIREWLGKGREETVFSQFWAMLVRQGHGWPGELLTDGSANIFYIRDAMSVLQAVCAHWPANRNGWHLSAYSVDYEYKWMKGDLVFSLVN